MKQTKLNIITKTEKYPIIIGSDLTSKISNIFKKNSINFKKCFLVVDKNVPKKLVSNIKKSLKTKKLTSFFLMQMKKIKILKVLIKL